jgi:Zn-dependent peptidase ImmA (M78 family)
LSQAKEDTMSSDVPYLKKEVIESEVALVLAEYGRQHGQVTAPPIPIDEIVELHLKLTLEIMDLQQIFGFGDVHGAIWFRSQRVGIDQSLDPARIPAKRGRYHFTPAHEAGHWRLHRRLYLRRMDQPVLFADQEQKPDYVCRSSEKKKPVEWQADQFAANLLRPRELVKQAWSDWHGSLGPIALDDLQDVRRKNLTAEVLRRGGFKAGDSASDDMVLEHCSRPLADRFQVSAEAMRIRLEDMGFLVRKREVSLF